MSNNLLINHRNFIRPNNVNNLINKKKKTNEEKTLEKLLIDQVKIDRGNKYELGKKFKEINTNKDSDLKNYWKERKNIPYKVILKDQDFNKNVKVKEDLIIHKISKNDKNEEALNTDYIKYKNNKKNHDEQLNTIYNENQKEKHTKDFEYKNKMVYSEKYNPKSHKELKESEVEYYKKEQERIEKGKKQKDELLDLIDNQIVIDEKSNNNNITTNTKENIKEIKNNIAENKINKNLNNDFYEIKKKNYDERQKKIFF